MKGKRALLRKLAILERRWTLVPKNQLPSLLGFVQRLHRRKSKGLCVEGCGVHDRLMNIFLICWLVRINIFNLLCPTSLGSTYFWLAYSQHFPPRRKFQYMQDSSKGMAWNITYSPLGRKKGPWLCLMSKLLLFYLVWLFSFISAFYHFLLNLFFGTRSSPSTTRSSYRQS